MKTLFALFLLVQISAQAQRTTSHGNMVNGFETVTSATDEWISVVDPITKQSKKIAINNLSVAELATYFTSAESKSILSNGSDMTSAINTALSNSEVKGLVMNTKTGSNVVVNGTVTVPAGKYLVFNGNKLTGTGTITGGTVIAYPDQQIFDTTLTITNVRAANNIIYPEWFGAVSGDATDDVVAIQKTADYLVANTVGAKILQFGSGEYRISKGVSFHKINVGGIEYDPINITIRGLNSAQITSGAMATIIRLTSDSSFAINIQEGKGCIIENIGLIGTNTLSYTNAQIFTPATTFVAGNQSTNQYSPQAGLVFDAFGNITEVGNRYKDFSDYYTNISNGGSTTCIIKNVRIEAFVVGVVMSPNGTTKNNEGHWFDHVWLGSVREGIVTCNNQERSVRLTNINCWTATKTLFANNVYGLQEGAIPMIDVVNVAGGVFQIMDFNGGGGSNLGSFSNIFAESMYRIGRFSGRGATFVNCQFHIADPNNYSLNVQDYIYSTVSAKTAFVGCTIIYYVSSVHAKYPLNMVGNLKFLNCTLSNQIGVRFTAQFVYNFPDYDQCDFHGLVGYVNEGDLLSAGANYISSGFITYGTEVTTMGGGTAITLSNGWKAKQVRRSMSPLVRRIPLGSVSVTVTGSTASFTVANLADVTALDGLIIYSLAFTYSDGTVGGQVMRIDSIDGSGVVTCSKVVQGFTTGTYSLFVETLTQSTAFYIADISGTSATNVIGASGAATLTNGGLFYIYGGSEVFVTASASGTATFAYNNSSEGDRAVIAPYEYTEYGFTDSDPLTNALFPSGTLFTKGAVYRKVNGTDDTYGWQCTKSGFKGSALAPEFTILQIPPAP